jgi:hypothetical protein
MRIYRLKMMEIEEVDENPVFKLDFLTHSGFHLGRRKHQSLPNRKFALQPQQIAFVAPLRRL